MVLSCDFTRSFLKISPKKESRGSGTSVHKYVHPPPSSQTLGGREEKRAEGPVGGISCRHGATGRKHQERMREEQNARVHAAATHHRPSPEHEATQQNNFDFVVCERGTLLSFCITWPCCEAFNKTHFHKRRDGVLKRADPCLQTGGCFSVSQTRWEMCWPLAEPSRVRLFQLPGLFVPGLLHPRRPSSVLSPAFACFSSLLGSKTMEENSKPVAQGLPGSNAGFTVDGQDRDVRAVVNKIRRQKPTPLSQL